MVRVVITIPYFPYSCVITAYKGNTTGGTSGAGTVYPS